MESGIQHLKGIHPGLVLERELKKRHLAKGPFALSIQEYPQILGAITKGKRRMNTALALKIEHALGIEEGYFMILQVYYDIKEEKARQHAELKPDLAKFRPVLFWDTTVDKIDWIQMKRWVIQRVLERGTQEEIEELMRFYGKGEVERYRK